MEQSELNPRLPKAISDETLSPSPAVSGRRTSISRKLSPFVILGAGLIGCGNQDQDIKNMKNIGSVEQMSVADGYQNKVMVPAPVTVDQFNKQEYISSVKDSGTNWEIYFSSDVNGGSNDDDVFWAKIDKNTLQTVQGPTIVTGANNISPDSYFTVCSNEAYYASTKDYISSKLYVCDMVNATTVNNCTQVPNINASNADIAGIACSPDQTKLYVTKIATQNSKPWVATIGVWSWTEPAGCAEPGVDMGGLSVTNQHFVYDTFNASQPNLNSAIKYKLFDGTKCTSSQMDVPTLNQSGYDVSAPIIFGNKISFSKGVEGAGNMNPYFADEIPTTPICGNGTKEGTEQCDNGANNTNTPCNAACNGSCNYCDTNCVDHTVAGPSCGGNGGTGGTGAGGSGGAGLEGGAGGAGATGAGGSGTGGNPEGGTGGGTAGAGGDSVDCKILNVTNNPQNITIDSCDDAQVSGHLIGPTTFTVGSKVFTINSVVPNTMGGFTYTMPNQVKFDNGVSKTVLEAELDPKKKLVDHGYGGITGYEGTEVEDTIPSSAAINPNLDKGDINVICTETLEGAQRKYLKYGCDPTDLAKCDPNDAYTTAGGEAGLIPKGTKLCTELKSGKVSPNPEDFAVAIDPLPKEPAPDCACSTPGQVSDNTYGALLALGLVAAAGLRRRKRFVGVGIKEA